MTVMGIGVRAVIDKLIVKAMLKYTIILSAEATHAEANIGTKCREFRDTGA